MCHNVGKLCFKELYKIRFVMEPELLTHRTEPRGVKLHLGVLHEAESVTMFKLDVRLLLQLFFSSGFFVRVKLQPGGNWKVVCDTKETTKGPVSSSLDTEIVC